MEALAREFLTRRGLVERFEEVASDPAVLIFRVAAPVPAVDLLERFEFVAALDGEDGGVEGLGGAEGLLVDGLEPGEGDVAVAALGIFGPDPAGPGGVGATEGDFISDLEVERFGVFFFVICVGEEAWHGGSLAGNGGYVTRDFARFLGCGKEENL